MPGMFHQEGHDGMALRRAAQPRALQSPSNPLDVHVLIRLIPSLDFVKLLPAGCQASIEMSPVHLIETSLVNSFRHVSRSGIQLIQAGDEGLRK